MKLFTLILLLSFSSVAQPSPPTVMRGSPGISQGDAARRQMKVARMALKPELRAVVPPKTVTISWECADPTVSFNVYHSTTPKLSAMTLLMNVTVKQITLPENKAREFFGVKSLSVDGVESDWATTQ